MKIVRTFAAVAVAYLLAYNFKPSSYLSLAASAVLPVVIIFAAVFGILSFIAIERRQRLKEAVATELNKLRRIYHLGKNLGGSLHLRGWFTDLHGFVYDYLGSFEKLSSSDYDKANPMFRRIAYHVYTVPDLREVKEQVLYNELLAATSIVSDARQRISSLHKSIYTKSHWFELLVLAIIFTVCVIATTALDNVSRLMTANILAAGYILALTFLEHDIWTKEGDRRLMKEYVKNIARLELRRG